jgi:NDP-sugar pyrophosphorylase family protein
MVKKAVILAAGRGTRLRPLTDRKHKSLTNINGTTILNRLLDQLSKTNITEIVIVTGYLADSIKEDIGNKYKGMRIKYYFNSKYLTTNNIVSLQIVKPELNESIVLFECDLVVEDTIIEDLLSNREHSNIMVLDKFSSNMDGTIVNIDKNNRISQMILKKDQDSKLDYKDFYKTVNIYKMSKETALLLSSELDKYIKNNGTDDYYEIVLKNIIESKRKEFHALLTGSRKWIEIDDEEDLKLYHKIFS